MVPGDGNLRAVLFYDVARAANKPLAGEDRLKASIASIGAGVRWNVERNFSQRAVVGQTELLHKRLNYFVGEQRRLIDVAIQSYSAIKTGNIGLGGATGTLLVHSLKELRTLADQMVPEIRLESAKTILAST